MPLRWQPKATIPCFHIWRAAAEADIPVFLFNMTELDKDNIYYVSSIGYDQYNAGLEIGNMWQSTMGTKK